MVGYKTFLPHTRDNAFFLYLGGGIGVGVGTLLDIGESDYNPDNVLNEKCNVVSIWDISWSRKRHLFKAESITPVGHSIENSFYVLMDIKLGQKLFKTM